MEDGRWMMSNKAREIPRLEGESRNDYIRRLRQEHNLTFEEIGDLVQLTMERVRQICRHEIFLYITNTPEDVKNWARQIRLPYEIATVRPGQDFRGLFGAAEFVGWQIWVDCSIEDVVKMAERGDLAFLGTRLRHRPLQKNLRKMAGG